MKNTYPTKPTGRPKGLPKVTLAVRMPPEMFEQLSAMAGGRNVRSQLAVELIKKGLTLSQVEG